MKRILAQVRKELTQLRRDRLDTGAGAGVAGAAVAAAEQSHIAYGERHSGRRTGSRQYAHVTPLHRSRGRVAFVQA